jgi:hypothetical protein
LGIDKAPDSWEWQGLGLRRGCGVRHLQGMRLAENEGLDNKQNVHIVSKEKEWLGQDGKEERGKGQKGRSEEW